MRIEQDLKLDFKDVLLRPKRSTLGSRVEVNLERTFKFRHSQDNWSGIPIIAANMDHTGTFAVAEALSEHRLLTALSKFTSYQEWQKFAVHNAKLLPFVMVSSGSGDDDLSHLQKIIKDVECPFICLDVANGYSEHFVDFVKRVRELFPNKIIMAGNVVTGEMVEQLIISGADVVKVGIGSGSVCTTRNKTGVGYPQLSAIIECVDAAHGLHGHVCSDGGCTVAGDVVKAFAAGADFVMLGGMFAGHDECLGEIITLRSTENFASGQKTYKRFYGMSSAEAMLRHKGKVADYRTSEGKSIDIPYRGPIIETIRDILGGLRSACTYIGAARLKDLPKCATFIRVTQQLNEIYREFETE